MPWDLGMFSDIEYLNGTRTFRGGFERGPLIMAMPCKELMVP
jgi:hypothetical protein